MSHSVGRPSRSVKAQLRDRAEGLGVASLRGTSLSRMNMNELREAISLASAPRQEVRDGSGLRLRAPITPSLSTDE